MASKLGRAMTDTPDASASRRTVVHLVRHGEVHNPTRVLYGRIPGFGLSEDGRMMAKAAADFLAGRDVTLLLSSPLERARETAEPIAAQFGLPVTVDERLIRAFVVLLGIGLTIGLFIREPR